MLHTLRHVINDDVLWFDILNIFATRFAKSKVTTKDFVKLVSDESGRNLDYFFEQYLNNSDLPVLKYRPKKKRKNILELQYMWESDVKGFRMPVKVRISEDKYRMIFPDNQWKSMLLENLKSDEFEIAEHLYLIKTEQLK